MHSHGIIHRDIAGDNVLVTSENKIKIIDFGLAKIKTEILVRKYSAKTRSPFTKIKYTPPKVIAQRAVGKEIQTTESWDLYACGILFFEILTGRLVDVPEKDISDDMLNKTPCPSTIKFLLENGRSDDAPGGEDIMSTFVRELRKSGLDKAIETETEQSTLVQTLNQEIKQLQTDLVAKRGRTEFSDLVSYLSRMGLAYTVIPKKKIITLTYTTEKAGIILFTIDASDDRLLELATAQLRILKKQTLEVLSAVNTANWNLKPVKVTYDPDDGEVRLWLTIAHGYSSIPYEEFSALLSTLIETAHILAPQLEEKFGRNSLDSQTTTDGGARCDSSAS